MGPDLQASEVEQKVEPPLAIVTRRIAGVAQDIASRLAGDVGDPRRIGPRSIEVGSIANDVEANGAAIISRFSDAELVRSARSAIERNASLLVGKVAPIVRNGWLILEGEVDGRLQRRSAEDAVRGLQGIRGVSNNILIESEAIAQRVGQKIDETFVRNARLSAHSISVTACDHRIILSGCVRSAAEREEAEMAAWAVRGVAQVVNRIRATA